MSTPSQDGLGKVPWWRRGLARLVRRIVTEHSSPARLGCAVGLGVIIGTTPFIGFHLGLTLVLATLLGLNRVITYLAANISNPVFLGLLIFGSVQLGTVLLTGEWLPLSLEGVRQRDPWDFAGAWLLGSFILGVALGAPAGVVTWALMRAYRRRHPLPPDPVGEVMIATAARFAPLGRFALGYVRGKLKHDPVYRQLAERCPLPSPFVDLGCGRGQTAVLLAMMQPGIEGLGLDWEAAKVEQARRAAQGLPGLRFEAADVREAEVPPSRCILLIDVLHYNDAATQDRMLHRAAAALAPGGVLFVRDVDAARGWRSFATRWQERFGCFVRLNRGATLCFRPAADLIAVLQQAGLEASVVPSWADTPLANVLIEAHKQNRTIARV